VLGTFVTGSATASNILFSEFQASTAEALALPPVLMLAAQGLGAAIGNVVAPHNIIAGNAIVGIVARGRDPKPYGDNLLGLGPCRASDPPRGDLTRPTFADSLSLQEASSATPLLGIVHVGLV
jgi:hypothetical protein